MNPTLKLVVDTGISLLGLGLIVWIFYRVLRRSAEPIKLLVKWGITLPFVALCLYVAAHLGPFGPFLIVFMAVIMSLMWTPHIAGWLFSPITNLFDGGTEELEKKPYYSTALAKRNHGKPLEAIMDVRAQLAKFPNDTEGVFLLAKIQAEDMADLPGAEITINNFCGSPHNSPKQIAAAWTQLADWHLKIGTDVDSARATLEKIVARFPDTEIALQAEQRLAHLGGSEKILLGAHDRQRVAVPEGVQNVGLLDSSEFLRPAEIDPGKLAAAHVKHLAEHPHDAEVREKLALIYAHDFKRLDLAALELAQLIHEPKYTPKQVAHWLNLLANLQIELGADVATVRATLEQIVERFPGLPVAELAQRRLDRVKNEFRGREETSSAKLGVYEQNIGLKYGSPRKPG